MNRSEAYQILELSFGASREDIKKAYRKLVKQWHPDRNKSPEAEGKLKQINEAYEILTKPIAPPNIFDFSSIFGGFPRRDFSFDWDNLGGKVSITLELDNLSHEDAEKIVKLVEDAGFNIKAYRLGKGMGV